MRIDWRRGSVSWERLQRWLYPQDGLWKWRSTYHFVENSAYFVLRFELLLPVLSKFEGAAALKKSHFWWVVCLTYKVSWSVYSLTTSLTGLALYKIWYIQYLWWLVVKWEIGQNIETDEEHDEVCVGEDFSWLR